MRDRKIVAVLVAGLLASGLAAVLIGGEPRRARALDNPLQAQRRPAAPPVSNLSPSTTFRPVDVPEDPYANEPVVRIGTIEIPKIGLAHPVYHGITLNNIDQGPSHWPGTALPGENGNAVFAGHRVTHTHPFRDIDRLESGDTVIFTINGARTTYVVTGHEVVSPKALNITDQTPTPTATLFACHPPHFATYRYVVHLALTTG